MRPRKTDPGRFRSEPAGPSYAITEFGVRTDIVPGKTTSLPLTADKTGRFTFVFDVFRGSGHEDMSGNADRRRLSCAGGPR